MVQTNNSEILAWGYSRNFEPNILATGICSASWIVYHIPRVRRLTKELESNNLFKATTEICSAKYQMYTSV